MTSTNHASAAATLPAGRRMAGRGGRGAKVEGRAGILGEEGCRAGGEKLSRGVWCISEHNCAIWAVAQRYGQACTSEIEFIRAVLPEASVERILHMVAGAPRCAYEIRPAKLSSGCPPPTPPATPPPTPP